ncbi:MAG TPA: DUF5684 domain-containing protein [Pyrinomonadaceae bacterium]|nr:DUF5684 domain-containing protein [Pyrinomonadaceae bacterium]
MLILFALQSNPLFSVLKLVGVLLVLGFALYLYLGITLMLLARKTETPGAGLAWIPIANLFLMCRIARRPAWWGLLLLIPLLNLFFFALVWMSIAEVRGRPAWIGGLAVVPLIGLIVPLYLAVGQASAPNLTVASRLCPTCGMTIMGSENFCRNCGQAAPPPVIGRRTPAGALALMGAGWSLVALVLIGGFSWFLFFRGLGYTPPDRKAPDMPQRMAGTLTEFPVDSDANASTGPSDLIAQDVSGSAAGTPAQLPQERLPPGINRDNLTNRTSSLTSVVYRGRKRPQDDAPTTTTDQVYVNVLRVLPEARNAGQEMTNSVLRSTNGTRSAVRVQSPSGSTYVGSKIKTSQISVYILEKQGSDVLILVYAPTPQADDEAARLAANVGNGQGLNDYPEIRDTVWTLPQRAPSGLVLQEMSTQSRSEFGFSTSQLESARTDDPEIRRWLEYLQQLIPERIINARYSDASRRDWQVVVYDYASTRRAWNTWFFVKWTLGLGSQESVTVRGETGLYLNTDEGRVLIFQRGPYLIGIRGPAGASVNDLVALGNGVQV